MRALVHPDGKLHLLVVDDDAPTRSGLERLLTLEGFIVVTAASGSEAAELFARAGRPFDVVLTDVRMPEMGGLELLAITRDRSPEVPVILLTGDSDLSVAVSAMRAGAHDYLTKPVDMDALLVSIERAIEARELRRQAAEFQARNDELQREAARNLAARERLVAIVAHDLRSSLGAISLAVGAGARTDGSRTAPLVARSIRRMERLIDDLLDSAQLEAGTLKLRRSRQGSKELIDEVQAELAGLASECQVEVHVEAEERLVVDCDGPRIVQVLSNVTANAIRVTPPGRRVTLGVTRGEGATVRFTVDDEGPGVSSAEIARMFDPFRRGENESSKGWGLGLSIARGIVQAHGGSISVTTATNPGVGTRFTIEIPLSAVSERPIWHLVDPDIPSVRSS